MHVLIIEDELLIAMEVQACVEEILPDVTVDLASNPKAAVAAAAERCPGLILSDYNLKQGTGVEAVQEICARIAAVPVVYVTASPKRVRAAHHGAPVVEKPFMCRDLAHAIESSLG